MQELWSSHLDWDTPLSEKLLSQWLKIYRELPHLNGLTIPRWTSQGSDCANASLHGFSDASQAGYAAVVYLRIVSLTGDITVSLLMSKTRVAPLKRLTIPKLELCAAALLAKLMSTIANLSKFSNIHTHCWTDSTTVLAWIRNGSSRLETFVANRVSSIQTQLPDTEWHHVSGHSNPADLASRGALAPDLRKATLWWRGSSWLHQPESDWPVSSINQVAAPDEPCVTILATGISHELDSQIYKRFSSWPRMLRVTALICRWLPKVVPRSDHQSIPVNADEVRSASIRWSRILQRVQFEHELTDLENHQTVSTKSTLKTLNPFIDEDGLIRVGGRIQNANLSASEHHPIILRNHYIVRLIVHHAHLKCLHGGLSLTLKTAR